MATAKRKFFAHSKQQSESAAASFEESSVFTKSNRKTGVNLRYETQFDPTFERMEPRILLSADLLGGAKNFMIGSLIEEQFKGNAGNWPFGAAASMILLSMVLIILLIFARHQRRAEAVS